MPDPSSHPEVARLSRFDGSTFHPIEPGSIDSAHIHVFAHGWQPGFRFVERLHAVNDGVRGLHSFDPRLVDASGRTLISYYLPLLEALAARGPEVAVLLYSWVDESATPLDPAAARMSLQFTQINGRRLAIGLHDAIAANSSPQIHLIGHSHGSSVVTHAAVTLAQRPAQLTLLDAPEDLLSRASGAADLIDLVLPRLPPGRSHGTTFVDSYASLFGRPYHQHLGLDAVVDVWLPPPPSTAIFANPIQRASDAHLWALEWYARSVRQRPHGVGFGWSPLLGIDPSELRQHYAAIIPLRTRDLVPLPSWRHRAISPTQARRPARDELSTVPNAPTKLTLSERIREAAVGITAGATDHLLEFDIVMSGVPLGPERLDLFLDGAPAFTAALSQPVADSGRYLMLTRERRRQHLLTAQLRNVPQDSELTVELMGLTLVSQPRASSNFTEDRTVATVAALSGVAGSAATVAVMLIGRRLARLLRRLRRHDQVT